MTVNTLGTLFPPLDVTEQKVRTGILAQELNAARPRDLDKVIQPAPARRNQTLSDATSSLSHLSSRLALSLSAMDGSSDEMGTGLP